MSDVIQELGHLAKLAKVLAMSLKPVWINRARCCARPAISNIIMAIPTSNDRSVMRESRMQGQLACPVWRGLGRNDSQQWEDRAPLLPYITKLLGPAKWTYFYLYVMLDIFSRYVVGWLLADRESSQLAQALMTEACSQQNIQPNQLTIHADRGSAMIAKPVALLLSDLGVIQSHSRPHVSNANPFSESQFKTLKYRPDFPDRFGSQLEARTWTRTFFPWYNTEHRHSGIGYFTPAAVHYGTAQSIFTDRQRTLQLAYAAHPERFVKGLPVPPAIPTAVWINPPNAPAVVVQAGDPMGNLERSEELSIGYAHLAQVPSP